MNNEKDTAERFNHYFASVFTRDESSTSEGFSGSATSYTGVTTPTCLEITLDITMVSKALSRLRPDKSMGPDGLSPKLLMEVSDLIAYPLLLLFNNNKSLSESSY